MYQSIMVKYDNPRKFICLNRIPVADIFQTRKRRQVLNDDDDDHCDDDDVDDDGDEEVDDDNIVQTCKYAVHNI